MHARMVLHVAGARKHSVQALQTEWRCGGGGLIARAQRSSICISLQLLPHAAYSLLQRSCGPVHRFGAAGAGPLFLSSSCALSVRALTEQKPRTQRTENLSKLGLIRVWGDDGVTPPRRSRRRGLGRWVRSKDNAASLRGLPEDSVCEDSVGASVWGRGPKCAAGGVRWRCGRCARGQSIIAHRNVSHPPAAASQRPGARAESGSGRRAGASGAARTLPLGSRRRAHTASSTRANTLPRAVTGGRACARTRARGRPRAD